MKTQDGNSAGTMADAVALMPGVLGRIGKAAGGNPENIVRATQARLGPEAPKKESNPKAALVASNAIGRKRTILTDKTTSLGKGVDNQKTLLGA